MNHGAIDVLVSHALCRLPRGSGEMGDMERHGETRGEQRVRNEDEEHARPLLMCFPWVPPVLFGLDLENMPLAVHSQVHPGA